MQVEFTENLEFAWMDRWFLFDYRISS